MATVEADGKFESPINEMLRKKPLDLVIDWMVVQLEKLELLEWDFKDVCKKNELLEWNCKKLLELSEDKDQQLADLTAELEAVKLEYHEKLGERYWE